MGRGPPRPQSQCDAIMLSGHLHIGDDDVDGFPGSDDIHGLVAGTCFDDFVALAADMVRDSHADDRFVFHEKYSKGLAWRHQILGWLINSRSRQTATKINCGNQDQFPGIEALFAAGHPTRLREVPALAEPPGKERPLRWKVSFRFFL